MAVWPVTLPQSPLAGSLNRLFVPGLVRTSMDVGPAKTRPRGKQPTQMSMSFYMTDTQIGYLETFLQDTIYECSEKFDFPDPVTGSTVEARVIPSNGAAYSLKDLGPGTYEVSMTFEVYR